MYRDQGGVGAGAGTGARAGAEADWGDGAILDLALDTALAPRLAAVALKYEACSSLTFIPRSMRRYLGFMGTRLSPGARRRQGRQKRHPTSLRNSRFGSYFVNGIPKSLQIFRASRSTISPCRGTEDRRFFAGLLHHEWLPPSRTKTQPCLRRCLRNCASFI